MSNVDVGKMLIYFKANPKDICIQLKLIYFKKTRDSCKKKKDYFTDIIYDGGHLSKCVHTLIKPFD